MISTETAKIKIIKNKIKLGSETIPIENSFNGVPSHDIIAPNSHPLFDQSAVDGYAINWRNSSKSTPSTRGKKIILQIIGEIKAGDTSEYKLKQNETVRIFTGAKVPPGCDAVVMQENIEKYGHYIYLNHLPKRGENIRKKGKQIRKGEIALKKGNIMNAASIGFLKSLGFHKIKISRTPKIGIIVTGNEFLKKKKNTKTGKIFESNSVMLSAILKSFNIIHEIIFCRDDKLKLKESIIKLLNNNNIILVLGGVSVGEYDFSRVALESIGFRIIFHGVSQTPGKPLLFARKGNKIAFGLPGNPRSVLVCFYEYVYPYIFSSMGSMYPLLKKAFFSLSENFCKENKRAMFLSGRISDDKIIITHEESHMLKSFNKADGIIFLKEGQRTYKKGEKVEVHLLPH